MNIVEELSKHQFSSYALTNKYKLQLKPPNRNIYIYITEADPDPNQRGGAEIVSGGAAGGAETISGVGAEGAETISGGQEGGQVIFEGGLVPPLAPPWIRH